MSVAAHITPEQHEWLLLILNVLEIINKYNQTWKNLNQDSVVMILIVMMFLKQGEPCIGSNWETRF